MDNELRVLIGKNIIDTFGNNYGHDESNMRDIISDLCHHAAWTGLTIEQIEHEIRIAVDNFKEEVIVKED